MIDSWTSNGVPRKTLMYTVAGARTERRPDETDDDPPDLAAEGEQQCELDAVHQGPPIVTAQLIEVHELQRELLRRLDEDQQQDAEVHRLTAEHRSRHEMIPLPSRVHTPVGAQADHPRHGAERDPEDQHDLLGGRRQSEDDVADALPPLDPRGWRDPLYR